MQRYTSIIKNRAAALGVLGLITSLVLSMQGMLTPVAQAAPAVFRVDAAGNITKNGTIFRVKGGSWFGLQGRHEPSTDSVNPSGAPLEQYMGNVFWNPSSRTYDQDVSEFVSMGINVVRLPLVTQTLKNAPCDPQGLDPMLKNTASVRIQCARTALETVAKKLDAAGISILWDIHSCSNYVDWRKGRLDARPPYVDATRDNYDFKREDSSCSATNNPPTVTRIQAYNTSLWLQDLQTLAGLSTSLGLNNVIGIDIYNEPWDYTWTDWKNLAGQAYTTINAVNPNILIFVEGTSDTANNQDGIAGNEVAQPYGVDPAPNWGGNLFSAGANLPAIPNDRLVFSPHVYGISVFVGKQFVDQTAPGCAGLSGDAAGDAHCPLIMPSAATLQAGWQAQWGYLKAQGHAVVIGEWGGNMQWPGGKASLRDQNRYAYVTNHTIDQQWQNALVDYLLSKGIYDNIYWSINPESGDTGGLYTHVYDPISNTSGWGTWGALDSTKMTLVHRLWDAAPAATPTPCPSCPTPTWTNTPVVTNTPTNTLVASNTPTNTPIASNTPTNTPVPSNTPTNTPVPSNTPTNTAGPSPTPTNTLVASNTPTNTPIPPTPTITNTPVPGGNPCSTPTVITGGGSYSVTTAGVCFKYVNTGFLRGAMWSVMNPGDSTVVNTVKWYGGRNETVTNCINDSQTLTGNGAQINNFTVGKDSNGATYVTVTGNKVNTVTISIQNWQNGTGCSVAPTPGP